MAVSSTIKFASLDELFLDPHNMRLGRGYTGPNVSQERLMQRMRGWSLEALAVSFLESGFWPQEAVIVVKENLYGRPPKLVVVEGNRRIAALKNLKQAADGDPPTRMWRRLLSESPPDQNLFNRIPYLLSPSRADITAFIGFRHVTGIKEWPPTEKAQFIAQLVDDEGKSYEVIRKQIGSQTEAVRRNYIAYRILLQMEDIGVDVDIDPDGLDRRFSVLFLSLRHLGVQSFLGVNIRAEPDEARVPVPEDKTEDLAYFGKWLFGTADQSPLFTDSREVGNFAKILADESSVAYLKQSPDPSFTFALEKAGVEEEEICNHLREANVQMQLALGSIHLHTESESIRVEMLRLGLNAKELLNKFPDIAAQISPD